MPAVFVSDLDGTLLDNEGCLPVKTREGLEELIDHGVLFSIATARGINSLREIVGDLRIPLPVVTVNGAYVSEYTTGEHLYVSGIESSAARQVVRLARHRGMSPILSVYGPAGDQLLVAEIANKAMQWFVDDRRSAGDPRLKQVSEVESGLEHQVTCITLMGEWSKLQEVRHEIHERCTEAVQSHLFENLYSLGSYWLTIHGSGATKAEGIRKMLQQSGLVGAKLVVYGDHSNDLEMFQLADIGIAVANAVPELKRIASVCIGSNQAQSVIDDLRRRAIIDASA